MVITGVLYKSRACNTHTDIQEASTSWLDRGSVHTTPLLFSAQNQWTDQESPVPGVCIIWANHMPKSWGFQSSGECVADSYRRKWSHLSLIVQTGQNKLKAHLWMSLIIFLGLLILSHGYLLYNPPKIWPLDCLWRTRNTMDVEVNAIYDFTYKWHE